MGCAIKNREAADKIIELTARFSALGVAFHVWDANGIYDRLRGAPSVVRTHLGQAWYAHLFGEPAGPLTGLHRELQTGDLAALRVQGYVARLNQAEAAEIAEWRRRIRRGESDKVAAELRYALADPAGSGATAPELRAQQLRLLAGILLPGGEASSIKAMLDEADRLDGTSERLRAVLLMESVGPEAALESLDSVDQADLAEVRSIAQLRLGRADLAGLELALYLNRADTSAETLRISALAALLKGIVRAPLISQTKRPGAMQIRGPVPMCWRLPFIIARSPLRRRYPWANGPPRWNNRLSIWGIARAPTSNAPKQFSPVLPRTIV